MSNYTDVAYTGDRNTTWYKMQNNIPDGSRVLDVGCSSGNFGEFLTKNKKCEVIGIDLDKKDVVQAKRVLKAAYVMNVEEDDFSKLGKFDRIIFADVLEHLQDPVTSLKKIKKSLKPNGQILFSIPNMAHMGTRLMLLTGKFEYGETGLLDKTHLHFYDENEVRRIFNDAGFQFKDLDWTEYYIPEAEVNAMLAEVGLKPTRQFIKDAKKVSAVALQYVGAVSPSNTTPKIVDLPAMSPWVKKTDEYIEGRISQMDEKNELLQTELQEIKMSTSWRLTKPLRAVSYIVRTILNKIRT